MIPGRVVDDKYRIRRVIGRGGMSVVVEADHLLLGHKVAIKFLRTDVARALAAEIASVIDQTLHPEGSEQGGQNG